MVHLRQDSEKQKDPRLPAFADCHLYIYPTFFFHPHGSPGKLEKSLLDPGERSQG